MNNALALTNLLLGLIDRQATIAALLARAHAEGRDVTAEELDALFAADDVARAELQRTIDAAKAG